MAPPRTLTIGLLEAGPLAPALAPRFGSHSQFFRTYLGSRGPDIAFASYRVFLDEFPGSPTQHDAFLVTGSKYSVYDPLPWIGRLKSFVHAAAATRPVVGICFGHQLVAEAFGGRVRKAEQGWGVGVHRYTVSRRPTWMQPVREEIALIASHQDQVVQPPPGAQVLAGNSFCPIGAMQIGRNVISLQMHPEMQAEYGRALYDMRREVIGSERIDAAVASLAQPTDADAVAEWILGFIRARAPAAERRPD